MLEETKLTEEQQGFLETIKRCGRDLLVIINDILDFSKLDAGKLILESKPFNLHDVIEDVSKLLKKQAQQKSIKLTTSIDTKVPASFNGDVTRVGQILINLTNNGIKFTLEGEVSVHVSSKIVGDTDKHLVRFTVKDTGIGISPDEQSKLFQSFSQVDASITRRYGGTGLGLAISYRMAELMQGRIWVESEKGKGSTFYLEIPLQMIKPTEQNLESSQANEKPLPKDLKILVVEDNDINRQLAVGFLKKLGYDSETAVNGKEAVQKVLDQKFDVVLMDMQMPIMDGVTAAKEIIEKLGLDKPTIIAMTANVLPEDKKNCFDAGMDDFIGKPIMIKSLKKALAAAA